MTQPTNAKGRPFSWSFSRWNDFENCPAKYAAASFYCTLPYVQSPEAEWGDRVHKAAEMFLKGIPHKDIEALKPVEAYCTKMLRSGCRIEAEKEVVLNKDLKPVKEGPKTWFSKNAWLRVKIDVALEKSNKINSLFDFKTGRTIKYDTEQLELNALALGVLRPQVEVFEGRYIWTQHKQVTPIGQPMIVKREDVSLLWEKWLERVYRMEQAWRLEKFPERPSGLCGWCNVGNCKSRKRPFIGG